MEDKVVSVHPYYKVSTDDIEAFKKLANDLIETTRGEMGCLYYGWSFSNGEAFCREGYTNAEAALAHLSNVEDLLQRMNQIAEITRLEVHGSEQEIEKLKGVMKKFNPKYFILKGGFRN